jgi:hypothetical protein
MADLAEARTPAGGSKSKKSRARRKSTGQTTAKKTTTRNPTAAPKAVPKAKTRSKKSTPRKPAAANKPAAGKAARKSPARKTAAVKPKPRKTKARKRKTKETPEELRARNLAAFKKDLSGVYNEMANYEPKSSLIYTETGEPDIEFMGTHLYNKKGAYAYTRDQLDQFWQTPNRLYQGLLDSKVLDSHSGEFGTGLMRRVLDTDITFRAIPESRSAYFLVVMGIGLAPHLDELVEETNCQSLLIIEPNLEFLYHSTFVFDWERLVEKFSGDRSMQLILSSRPEDITTVIQATIRGQNPAGLDGTVFYTHYPNSVLQKSYTDLRERDIAVGMMGLGFFEDEIHMITQTFENLRGGKVRILDEIDGRMQIPVFIVGSGPSLDETLPIIKENQDKAVIIGCGSALDPLLANGITPDFLVLLERDPDLLPFQQGTSKEFDMSGICLVGATNLYPGIAELYDEAIMFFRPGISPFPMFARNKRQMMVKPDPLVANGALSFAQRTGFREFYFFGVDVGAKDADYHHSKYSWYNTKGMQLGYPLDTTAPGNFGGMITTGTVFLWSKNALEQAIRAVSGGRHYYNCSDGGRIDGAIPRHPSTVSLPKVRSKKKIVRELIDRFPFYTDEDFEAAWTEADLHKTIPEFCEELAACLKEHDFSDMRYLTAAMKLLKPGTIDDGVAMVFRGSVYFMLMILHSYGQRITTKKERTRFQRIARKEFAAALKRMSDEALEFFESVETGTHVWNV